MNSAKIGRKRGTFFHLVGVTLVAATFFFLGVACNEGREGDRCNPDLFPGEDECGSGLTCQTPSTCVESYCCPPDAAGSKNGYCNGTLCPPSPPAASSGG